VVKVFTIEEVAVAVTRWVRHLGALAADAAGKLDVLGHDGDALKGGPYTRSRGGLTLSIFEVL